MTYQISSILNEKKLNRLKRLRSNMLAAVKKCVININI